MALKGKLRDFRLTQLLNLIHLARKSGALSIQSAEGQAVLYFSEGKLTYAALAESPTTLADLMVQAGRLTPVQAAALQASGRVRDDKQLGLLLINAGQASKGEIVQALRKNTLDIVQHVLGWDDGAFVFDQTLAPPADRIAIPISLEGLILEGGRQANEVADLHLELPSLDVVLKFTEGPGSNLRNINLSVEEWKVISFINPRNTIATIARYNQMNDFQVRKIVAKLLRDELVEIVGTSAPRPTIAPPTATPMLAAKATAPTAPPPLRPESAKPSFTKPEVGKSIIRRLIDRIKSL